MFCYYKPSSERVMQSMVSKMALIVLLGVFTLQPCRGFVFHAQTQNGATHVADKNDGRGRRLPGRYRPYGTALLDQKFGSLDDSGIDISVSVQRNFPNVSPRKARDAWIEYHWKKGGGLPIAVLANDGGIESSNSEAYVLERTIMPVFMKEKLQYSNTTDALLDTRSVDLHYEVIEAGPFFADLVPNSHSAVVKFEAIAGDDPGCTMTWHVSFSSTRWSSFYEAFTQWSIGTAATTVQEAIRSPRLFYATTTIDIEDGVDPVTARGECLDFVFAEGGGLPLPPPIPFGRVVSEGGGSARQNLLRIPPLITESIVDTQTTNEVCEFTYRLNSPGWLTFPFLLHTHLGRVRFSQAADSNSNLVIDWNVEIRPYQIVSPVVEKLVEMTVSTILRNFRIRLTSPNSVVVVKPPRGNTNLTIGTVKRDTWIGAVLAAHLSDTRTSMEQTMSLFKPWTWGRSGGVIDCVQFQWTDGNIE